MILLTLSFLNLNIQTTGDTGDSIVHFLFSKYALRHPELFYNHWAKPFFVFSSTLFSQLGWKGIVQFNILYSVGTTVLLVQILRRLDYSHPYLVIISLYASPQYFSLLFSGLTEFYFAFLLVLGIYLIIIEKWAWGAIVFSILPMVRTEGLFILVIYGLYFMYIKQWRAFLLLSIGQLIYAFAGYPYHHDLLWIFKEIPYRTLSSTYGQGVWTDFINHLIRGIERPQFFIFLFGALYLLFQAIRELKKKIIPHEFLILSCFLTIYIAHIAVWSLGICQSMGLSRVLNMIIPLSSMIIVMAIHVLTRFISSAKMKCIAIAFITGTIVCVPFIPKSNYTYYHKNMFQIDDNNIVDSQVNPFLNSHFPNFKQRHLYYTLPYFSLSNNLDFFDQEKRHPIYQLKSNHPIDTNAIVIWDYWYAVVEEHITWDEISQNKKFKLVKAFYSKKAPNRVQIAIFIPQSISQ